MESTKILADKDTILSDDEKNEWLLELSSTASKSFDLLNELLEWSNSMPGISKNGSKLKKAGA